MANILSLAMKVSADASGVVKNLTPAERALENLGRQAAKTTAVFDQFTKTNEAAANTQAQFNEKFAALAKQLESGLDATAYADQYAALQAEVRATAEAFTEAAAIIAQGRTDDELRAETLARLSELLQVGALDNEQYARAVAEASGANAAAAKAEEERLRLLERGRQITEQFLTDEERRSQKLKELNALVAANAISDEAAARARFEFSGLSAQLERDGLELRRQIAADREADAAREQASLEAIAQVERRLAEDSAAAQRLRAQETARASAIIAASRTPQDIFNAAVAEATSLELKGLLTKKQFNDELRRQADVFARATVAAEQLGVATEDAAKKSLKFNEISGILAALPGPLGSIAGRFSGLSSAAEGLNRVFSGGLSTGVGSISSQISALATPINIGIASFAAFGAAATAITRGLADLEGRVEQLGNTALRLGTDFETIQILDEAARRSGVSIDSLAAGIQKLAVNINEARSGTGKAAEAFAKLGISQQELIDLDPAALAERTAAALQGIEDPALRAALATETLGKAGLALLPGFNAIGESEEALRRFSATISEIDRDRIGSLGQAFDNVKTSLAGLGQATLLPFAGIVEGVANLFADFIGTVTRLAQAIGLVLTPVLDGLGFAFGLLSDGLAAVNGLFDYLTGSNQKTAAAVGELRAEMEEPLDAGFAKEFEKTLQGINSGVSQAIDDSVRFGAAGFDAALEYQNAIAQLKEQLDAGLFNEETFRREAAKAGEAFKQELGRIQQDNKLEIQIESVAQKTLASLNEEISKAINQAEQFGQAGFDAALQFQTKIQDLGQQFENGFINEESLRRGVAAANAEYDKQIDKLKQAEAEQRKLIDGDRERLDQLLQSNDEAARLEQDLLTVQREQARVSEQLAAARAADNVAQADAAAARQAELDQLQAKLEEQQQALEQGFGQGFQAAFAAVDNGISGLIAKSQQFGQAGFDAALRLQEGIAAAQEQARDGVLNAEAFNQEVARQQELFNNEIKNIEEAEKARTKAAEDRVAAEKKQQDDAVKARQDAYAQQQKAAEGAANEQRRVQEEVYKQQQKIFEEQQKAAAAEATRQEDRLRKLNTLGEQSIKATDIRTVEGATLVTDLAASAQDPAMIQQRLQTKLLEKIAVGIGQAAANYFNQPVAIVGAARIGGIN
jgi:hypothetical protein